MPPDSLALVDVAPRLAGLALILVLALNPAQARVYEWVDEQGVTVFSQTPPPPGAGIEANAIDTAPAPPTTDPEDARRALEERVEALDQRREERREAEDEQRQARTEAADRRALCDQARARVAQLETMPRALLVGADGEARRLDDEELAKLNATALEQMHEACDGK